MIISNHKITLSLSLLALGSWLHAAEAQAEQVHYVGMHPITIEAGADAAAETFCYIELPHVHIYKPPAAQAKVHYRVQGNTYHFVGDPVAFGYQGPKHPYYGHHPAPVNLDVHVDVDTHEFDDEYCYIDGPHNHDYVPPPGASFEFKGDANWYVGTYPKAYKRHKKRYHQPVNAVYAPMVYERPVVVVDARPVAYVGPIVEIHAPAVIVETPHAHADVEVIIPTPSVHVDIGLPGVSVGHHGHTKYKRHKKFKGHGKRKHFKKRH